MNRLKVACFHASSSGNHDKHATPDEFRALFTNAIFLHDEAIYLSPSLMTVNRQRQHDSDICIAGHSWTHERSFVFRANACTASLATRRAKVARIARDVDVLLTHAPPYGIGDDAGGVRREGCLALREALSPDADAADALRPLAVLFGHCHGAFGHVRADGIEFVNAAQQFGFPVVFELDVDVGGGDDDGDGIDKTPTRRRRRKQVEKD